MLAFVLFVVFIALVFDFVNGFHDAANSIATVVGTRVLTPRIAVIWAAFFNFVAAFTFETRVAKTIGKEIVDPKVVDPVLIFAALLGAIVWNLLTWWWGLPSSSSHALIGGFAGAAVAKAGPGVLVPSGLTKTAAFIVLSPLIGMVLGFLFFLAVIWIFRKARPEPVDRLFRRVQLASAAAFSFGHGLNDAQKTMGIIAVLLFSAGYLPSLEIPFWIILLCNAAIGLGTLAGGWRIVRTMGLRITALKPVGGSCAEFAGAITLFGASWAGIPVSTTHTITGAIMGVGSVRRMSAVRWGVARTIVTAWVLTIPASALVAALCWWLLAGASSAFHMKLP
ncbi:MAG TPA: inorganic phosphate transporter [Thermoanaerobaculia bacterium]|nr:inorganic phosphate transporter [Thermoanaerobaculia bacterium]HQR66689.1 inorganic phosphate transporter [Thermoanaerobaculia bacterium]